MVQGPGRFAEFLQKKFIGSFSMSSETSVVKFCIQGGKMKSREQVIDEAAEKAFQLLKTGQRRA
jgi:hypothetical protein